MRVRAVQILTAAGLDQPPLAKLQQSESKIARKHRQENFCCDAANAESIAVFRGILPGPSLFSAEIKGAKQMPTARRGALSLGYKLQYIMMLFDSPQVRIGLLRSFRLVLIY